MDLSNSKSSPDFSGELFLYGENNPEPIFFLSGFFIKEVG